MIDFNFEVHNLAEVSLRMFREVMSGYIYLNSLTETTGKDLFRVTEIDKIISRGVKSYIFGEQLPPIEHRWKAVLAIRLMFAHDVCSGCKYQELYTDEGAISTLEYIMTAMWNSCGLEWLLCRSKFPMIGCSLSDELKEITQRMTIREGVFIFVNDLILKNYKEIDNPDVITAGNNSSNSADTGSVG